MLLLLEDRHRGLRLVGGHRHVAGLARGLGLFHQRRSLRHVRARSLARSGRSGTSPRRLHVLVAAWGLDVLVATRGLNILIAARRLDILVAARGLDVLVATGRLHVLVATGRLHVLVTTRRLDVLVTAGGLDVLVTTRRLDILVTAGGLDVLVTTRRLDILVTAGRLDILVAARRLDILVAARRLHVLITAGRLHVLVRTRAGEGPRSLDVVGLDRRRLLAQHVLRLGHFGRALGLRCAHGGRQRQHYRDAENRCEELLHVFFLSLLFWALGLPARLPPEPGGPPALSP